MAFSEEKPLKNNWLIKPLKKNPVNYSTGILPFLLLYSQSPQQISRIRELL
jgi:hypothetical protein